MIEIIKQCRCYRALPPTEIAAAAACANINNICKQNNKGAPTTFYSHNEIHRIFLPIQINFRSIGIAGSRRWRLWLASMLTTVKFVCRCAHRNLSTFLDVPRNRHPIWSRQPNQPVNQANNNSIKILLQRKKIIIVIKFKTHSRWMMVYVLLPVPLCRCWYLLLGCCHLERCRGRLSRWKIKMKKSELYFYELFEYGFWIVIMIVMIFLHFFLIIIISIHTITKRIMPLSVLLLLVLMMVALRLMLLLPRLPTSQLPKKKLLKDNEKLVEKAAIERK